MEFLLFYFIVIIFIVLFIDVFRIDSVVVCIICDWIDRRLNPEDY